MLTYATGYAAIPSACRHMARHLMTPTLLVRQAELAAYYGYAPPVAAEPEAASSPTTPWLRPDLDVGVARRLGIRPGEILTLEAITQLLAGNRVDGRPIPGKQRQRQGVSLSLAEALGLNPERLPTCEEVERILRGRRADGAPLPEEREAALRRRFFGLYGLDGRDEPTPEAQAHMREGRRADGTPLNTFQFRKKVGEPRREVAYIDITISAPKSLSLAFALAATEAERAVYAQVHRRALAETMRQIERLLGRARRGKAGRNGADAGHIAWFAFDHYTARPSEADEGTTPPVVTRVFQPSVTGDPNLHTHVIVTNLVLTDERHAGGLDLNALDGRVKELGALYQAILARELRAAGVAVELDPNTKMAQLTAVPQTLCDGFSKRTRKGERAARALAQERDLDWDQLHPAERVRMMKQAVQDPRGAKADDLGDRASWLAEAAALGWEPHSLIEPALPPPSDRATRLERAYAVARDLLEKTLEQQAVTELTELRLAAARGLIAAGIDTAADIDVLTDLIRTRGLRQNGVQVALLPGTVRGRCGEAAAFTTSLHVDQEAEFTRLAGAAAAELTGALPATAIAAGVARFERASGLSFEAGVHGRSQRAAMDRLGGGGALALVIGVAGSGKSTLLAPLVDAWHTEGRTVYGGALAWRQGKALVEAGIPDDRCKALARLLRDAEAGELTLGPDSVVVLDELGLVGVRELLELLRLRARYGFRIVAVGDERQCASISAGPTIELLRQSLGHDAIPEILSTVRQREEQERETTGLFRQGRAAEALTRKRVDGTAQLIEGDEGTVAAAIADLWEKRHRANAHDPTFSLTVSAPTNAGAHALALAIRARRQGRGELTGGDWKIKTEDLSGRKYELLLTVGDRVRLHALTNGRRDDGGRGPIGYNGSIVTVRELDEAGVRLRNDKGEEAWVAWDTLRDPKSGCIRLTYGDVMTVHMAQGITSDEHIAAFPGGTAGVDAFLAYTAASRHRSYTHMVFAAAPERRRIRKRRPIGDALAVDEEEIWSDIAAALVRAPEQTSAHAFLARARTVRGEAERALPTLLRPMEERVVAGRPALPLRQAFARKRRTYLLEGWAEDVSNTLARQGSVLQTMLERIVVPRAQKPGLERALEKSHLASRFAQRRWLEQLETWVGEVHIWAQRQLQATQALLDAVTRTPLETRGPGTLPASVPVPAGSDLDAKKGGGRVRRTPSRKRPGRGGGGIGD